eukprot:363747-Chlamydomonas_euryale.AAC.10
MHLVPVPCAHAPCAGALCACTWCRCLVHMQHLVLGCAQPPAETSRLACQPAHHAHAASGAGAATGESRHGVELPQQVKTGVRQASKWNPLAMDALSTHATSGSLCREVVMRNAAWMGVAGRHACVVHG